MASPPQLVHMAFAAGLDESQQGEVLDPLKGFTVLQNVRQDKRGGLSKRLGYASLAKTRLDATSRSAGDRLFCHRNVIGVIDGTYLDVYSAGASVNVTRSRVPECSVTTRPTTTYAASVTNAALQDLAVCGNYAAYVYLANEVNGADTSSALVMLEDVTSGAVIKAPEILFTTTAAGNGVAICGVASYSTYFIAVGFDNTSGAGEVKAWYLNTTSAATITTGWVSIGTIGSAGEAANADSTALSMQSLTDRVAVGYVNASAGTSQVTLKTVAYSGQVETANINTSSATPTVVAVEGSSSDTLWVAWDETTSVRLRGVTPNAIGTPLATTATMITLATAVPSAIGVVSSSTAGAGRIVATDGNWDRTYLRNFTTSGGAATTSGSQISVPNAMLGSRPFRVGTRYYALFAPAPGNVTNAQATAVLCDFTEANTWLRPVANLAPSLAVFPSLWRCHIESIGSSKYVTGLSVQTTGATYSTKLVTFNFADRHRWRTVSHNGETMLSGGMLAAFDGSRVAELGFVVRPPAPTHSDSGTGITGSFRYVVVYEEADPNGNWCVSSISDPSSVKTVTNKTITVSVRPCSITARQRTSSGADVRVSLYRTTTTGEPPYYYLTSLPNDTSATTITYADATADVTANRLLYSPTLPGSGSAQDRRAPPHCQDLESYNGMLVVLSGPTLYWSGQTVDGEQTWFNPAFAVPVPDDGDGVAIRAQDGTLYVFKRKSIYAVSGEPPSDNGSSGGLGTPRKLAVDVGCIDPASIVVASLGIFFQSERGIELLGRGGAVSWIGEAVQDTLASYPVISAAVLDDRHGLVRFSLAASESSGRVSGNGRTLVFDLALNAWQSVDTITGAGANEASQDAAMLYVSGSWRHGWLGTDGTVYYERLSTDGSAHLDGSTWVTMIAETGWLKLGGIQGKHHVNKVLLLARKSTRADLSTYLTYDYGTTAKTVYTRAANDLDTLSTALERIQVEHQLHDEAEGQSVKVKFQDATPTGGTVSTGKGATWIAITFEGTPRQGAIGLPESGM